MFWLLILTLIASATLQTIASVDRSFPQEFHVIEYCSLCFVVTYIKLMICFSKDATYLHCCFISSSIFVTSSLFFATEDLSSAMSVESLLFSVRLRLYIEWRLRDYKCLSGSVQIRSVFLQTTEMPCLNSFQHMVSHFFLTIFYLMDD